MKTVALAVLLVVCPFIWAHSESIITLKSGVVLQGDIVSDTNDVVRIRAFSHNHTISALRDLARSDIQSLHEETPAEIAERKDYEALLKFQLDPNQEQTIEWYNQWIGVFQKFLSDYPASDKKPTAQHYIELCQAESQNVADGKVKIADRWMTVKEKRVQLTLYAVDSLKNKLADLERQRKKLTENIGVAEGNLAGAQQKLQSLQDSQVPINQTVVTGSGIRRDSTGRIISAPVQTQSGFTGAYQTIPNPERPMVLNQIQFYQQQIGQGQATLASLDSKIAEIQQSQIPQAQQAYQIALAESQEAPKPVVAKVEEAAPAPPPPPPPAAEAPPVAPAPPSWMAQNWYWVVIGGLVAVVLGYGLVSQLLKRRAARMMAYQDQQDEQRRFMYEQLKKIFDRIFVEGQRPGGKNQPEGEVVPLGHGQDDSGGGRWFVIGESEIWAVHNNGRADDNWALNNVVTDGRGAIGAVVAMDEELAEAIRRLGAGVVGRETLRRHTMAAEV